MKIFIVLQIYYKCIKNILKIYNILIWKFLLYYKYITNVLKIY
jgi:hypothetical protein